MTATALARNAYKVSAKSTASARTIEHQVLSRLTGDLAAASQRLKDDHPAYIRALSRNLEFWTILGTDVANPNNPLPSELRSRIFFLFEFTRTHTRKLLGGDTALTAEPLLEINRNILAGLRGGASKDETP